MCTIEQPSCREFWQLMLDLVPKGHLTIAQGFNLGWDIPNTTSPEGTAEIRGYGISRSWTGKQGKTIAIIPMFLTFLL
jgi:hypothetical protein